MPSPDHPQQVHNLKTIGYIERTDDMEKHLRCKDCGKDYIALYLFKNPTDWGESEGGKFKFISPVEDYKTECNPY